MMKLNGRMASLMVLLAGLLMTGCSGPKAYTIRVSLDEGLKSAETGNYPSLEVDIMALNPNQAGRLRNYSMSKYMQPDDDVRKDFASVRQLMQFDKDNNQPKEFKSTDPKWEKWLKEGAQELYILVNLPGRHEDKPGSEDSRRQILPLERKRWSNADVIEVVVKRSSLFIPTPMKPE